MYAIVKVSNGDRGGGRGCPSTHLGRAAGEEGDTRGGDLGEEDQAGVLHLLGRSLCGRVRVVSWIGRLCMYASVRVCLLYLADGVGEGGEDAEDDLVHNAREDEELGELRHHVGKGLIRENDAVL